MSPSTIIVASSLLLLLMLIRGGGVLTSQGEGESIACLNLDECCTDNVTVHHHLGAILSGVGNEGRSYGTYGNMWSGICVEYHVDVSALVCLIVSIPTVSQCK